MYWPVFSEKLDITSISIRLACCQDRDTTMGRLSLIHLENKCSGQRGLCKKHILFGKEILSLLPFVLKVMGYLFFPVESSKPKALADTFATGLL